MSKTTAELTVDLMNSITDALRIVKDLTPMCVSDDSSARKAEDNLLRALASLAESFLPKN